MKHTTQLCKRVDIGFCSFYACSDAHLGEVVMHSRQNLPVKREANRILLPDLLVTFDSFLVVEDLCFSFRLHLAQHSLPLLTIIRFHL